MAVWQATVKACALLAISQAFSFLFCCMLDLAGATTRFIRLKTLSQWTLVSGVVAASFEIRKILTS